MHGAAGHEDQRRTPGRGRRAGCEWCRRIALGSGARRTSRHRRCRTPPADRRGDRRWLPGGAAGGRRGRLAGRSDDRDDRRRAVVTPSPAQGEIWWAEAMDKRRPVLVVTRSEAVRVLTWVLVAPVTRTVRGIPTEISLGPEQGLPEECVASFDNLQPIRRAYLT